MSNSEENIQLHIQLRPVEVIDLRIPVDTIELLRAVAASRGMSLDALLKFYVGQGLRQDLAVLISSK
jgi:hypothetical protein